MWETYGEASLFVLDTWPLRFTPAHQTMRSHINVKRPRMSAIAGSWRTDAVASTGFKGRGFGQAKPGRDNAASCIGARGWPIWTGRARILL